MIEFTCNVCQQRLRVDDGYAGKRAKCPKCQNVLEIPVQAGRMLANAPGGTHSKGEGSLLGGLLMGDRR